MATYSQSDIYNLATQVGLSGQRALLASAIAMAESGGNTSSVNPGNAFDREYSVGLWQINLLAHPQYTSSQMMDPIQNARAMYAISSGGTNWQPWGTFTNGSYRQFMSTKINTVSALKSPTSTTVKTSPGTFIDPLTGSSLFMSTSKTNPETTTEVGSAWVYVLAYMVVIIMFVFVSRFQAGYNLLYYMAVLLIILIFVTMAPYIAAAIRPITQSPNDQGTLGNDQGPLVQL